jgi:hypothetical protein
MTGKGLEGEPSIPSEPGAEYATPSPVGVAESLLDLVAGWLAPRRERRVVRVPELRGMHVSQTFLPALQAASSLRLSASRAIRHRSTASWCPRSPSRHAGKARLPRASARSAPRRSFVYRPSLSLEPTSGALSDSDLRRLHITTRAIGEARALLSLIAKTMRAKRGLLEDGGAELGE